MKRILTLIFLLPSTLLAVSIPVEKSDQSKLETLLRRMPSTYINSIEGNDKVTKKYRFPRGESPFKITCESIWYGDAPLPTEKKCEIDVEIGEVQGIAASKINDVYQIKITEAKAVSEIYSAISFGEVIKKMNAFERVKGKAETGRFEEIFRYAFICRAQDCTVRVTALPPTPEE